MGPVVVVVELPLVEHPASFLQAEEQLPVEQLIAETAVEALDVAILPRAPLGDIQRLLGRVIIAIPWPQTRGRCRYEGTTARHYERTDRLIAPRHPRC